MLPSFRLIALTFLMSFAIVSGALRLIAPSRSAPASAGVSVETAAAPLQRGGVGSLEWRQADSLVPVIFDMRFNAAEPAAVPASLTLYAIDRAARAMPEPTAADAAPETVAPELAAFSAPEPTLPGPMSEERPALRSAPLQLLPPTLTTAPVTVPDARAVSEPAPDSMPAALPALATTGSGPATPPDVEATITRGATPRTAAGPVLAALPEPIDPLPESDMLEDDETTASVPANEPPVPTMVPDIVLPRMRPADLDKADTTATVRRVNRTASRPARSAKASARKPAAKKAAVKPARTARAVRIIRPAPAAAQPAANTTVTPFGTLFNGSAP